MSVLKYKDPVTGEYKSSGIVKLVEVVEGGAAEQLTASGYPDYVQPEVMEIVGKVNSVRKGDSIVFVAMSDNHYPANQTATTAYEFNKQSAVQANQAAKVMSYLVKPDFFAHLGDVCCGAPTTTPDMLKTQIEEFIGMFREAKSDLPTFLCIGNHDTGFYYGADHVMTGEYLYNTFTARSDSINTVMGGEEYGGYCYRDFPNKKLRVFMLNSGEGYIFRRTESYMLASQRLWFANALLNLNSKSNASEWKIVLLSHFPADYGVKPLSDLIKAYVTGSSITITGESDEGFTSTSVNFSGKNGAKFIAQFHGHIHNFKVDKLYDKSITQFDANRISIPNGQYDRENYYGVVGGVNYKDDITYSKTANTAEGTTFVVNVINPSEEKIYSFCYGAGYDRVIGYGAVNYYSITRSFTNVTSDNAAVSIEENTAYSEIITLDSGADMKTITVTMGGVDISSTAVSVVDGAYHISIPKVTGNVVITAKASLRPNFTNLVPLSINADGSDFYVDGDGYVNNTYISSSGATSGWDGVTTTGFIPIKEGKKIIRVAGDGISIDTEYTRFGFYDSNFEKVAVVPYKNIGIGEWQPQFVDDSNALVAIETHSETNHLGSGGVYMRVCTKGNGANLIVTVDEEISYGGASAI